MMLEMQVIMVIALWILGMFLFIDSLQEEDPTNFIMGAAGLMLAMWVGYTL